MGKKNVWIQLVTVVREIRERLLKAPLIFSCLNWTASAVLSAQTAHVPHVFAVVTSMFLTVFTPQVWMIRCHTLACFCFRIFTKKKLSRNWTLYDADQTDHSSSSTFDLHMVAIRVTFCVLLYMLQLGEHMKTLHSSVKSNKLSILWRKTKG